MGNRETKLSGASHRSNPRSATPHRDLAGMGDEKCKMAMCTLKLGLCNLQCPPPDCVFQPGDIIGYHPAPAVTKLPVGSQCVTLCAGHDRCTTQECHHAESVRQLQPRFARTLPACARTGVDSARQRDHGPTRPVSPARDRSMAALVSTTDEACQFRLRCLYLHR